MRRNISLETIKNQDPNITVGELIKIIESEYEKSEQERSDKINFNNMKKNTRNYY
jgi:hypothetical protein